MIRAATIDDVDAIMAMARRFYPESGYEAIGPMTDEAAAGLPILCIQNGIALVDEREGELVAMALLHVDHFMFNVAFLVAHELAFWIEPEHRGGMLAVRMLKAIEKACSERCVRWIRMAALATSPPQAEELYKLRGYAPSESYYTKVI